MWVLRSGVGSIPDIWVLEIERDMLLHMDEERTVETFLTTPFNEQWTKVSPDGTLIAYTSDETGTPEVYVRQFPSGAGRVKISPGLGSFPRWSPDGTELFCTNISGEYYSVALRVKDDMLIPGTPELMFELPDNEYSDFFSVAPDGVSCLPGCRTMTETGETA